MGGGGDGGTMATKLEVGDVVVAVQFQGIAVRRQIAVLIHSHGNEVNAVPIGMGVGVDDFNCGRALSVFENNTGGAEHDTLCLGLGYAKSHGKDDGANER